LARHRGDWRHVWRQGLSGCTGGADPYAALSLVHQQETIHVLAELGVVLLRRYGAARKRAEPPRLFRTLRRTRVGEEKPAELPGARAVYHHAHRALWNRLLVRAWLLAPDRAGRRAGPEQIAQCRRRALRGKSGKSARRIRYTGGR
jgi:hypothetical protein